LGKVFFPILLGALIYYGVHYLKRRKVEKGKEKEAGVQE
jgi:hypothetical protein